MRKLIKKFNKRLRSTETLPMFKEYCVYDVFIKYDTGQGRTTAIIPFKESSRVPDEYAAMREALYIISNLHRAIVVGVHRNERRFFSFEEEGMIYKIVTIPYEAEYNYFRKD